MIEPQRDLQYKVKILQGDLSTTAYTNLTEEIISILGWIDGVQYARERQGILQIRAFKICFLMKLLKSKFPDVLLGIRRRAPRPRHQHRPEAARVPPVIGPSVQGAAAEEASPSHGAPASPQGGRRPSPGSDSVGSNHDPGCPFEEHFWDDSRGMASPAISEGASSQARWPSECSSLSETCGAGSSSSSSAVDSDHDLGACDPSDVVSGTAADSA